MFLYTFCMNSFISVFVCVYRTLQNSLVYTISVISVFVSYTYVCYVLVYFVLYVYNCMHKRTIKYLVSCILYLVTLQIYIGWIFYGFANGMYVCQPGKRGIPFLVFTVVIRSLCKLRIHVACLMWCVSETNHVFLCKHMVLFPNIWSVYAKL